MAARREKKDGRLAAGKRIFHRLSAAFCVVLAILGVCLAAVGGRSGDSAGTVYLLAGFFQTVMSLIALLIGVLLPEEGRQMSGAAKKILWVLAALAVLGGKGTSGAAASRVLDGEVVFRRFWEPAWFVAWLLFEGLFLWFYPGSGITGAVVVLSMALLAALIAASLGWSILYRKEAGTFRWFYIAGPSLVVLLLFGAVFLVTFLNTAGREPALAQKLEDARGEIERALEDYEAGSCREEDIDPSRMTMEDIVAMLKTDIGGDVRYCLVPGDGAELSIVAWNDAGDDVYVYQFTKSGDTYILGTAFLSPSLTKADVEGKEHGVIEEG